jgi:hypothetical protein
MTEVRPYKTSDYEAVAAFYKQPGTFGGQFDEDRDSVRRLNDQAADDPDSILVAERVGIITGTVSLLYDKRFAWLVRFAISNEDKETAEALLQKASGILKLKGHDQILAYAPETPVFVERYGMLGFQKGDVYGAYWRKL